MKPIRYSFSVYDKSNIYEVTVYNNVIEHVMMFSTDSQFHRDIDFNMLPSRTQDLIIERMTEAFDE